MARSRGGSRPTHRGTTPVGREGGRPTQKRATSTLAAPLTQTLSKSKTAQSQKPQNAQQPGLFYGMLSTAAGVAVGSTIGHTLSSGIAGFFSGSSTNEPPEKEMDPFEASTSRQEYSKGSMCDSAALNFTRCLDSTDGNYQPCEYYLQQLKACQEAARHY
ncbi:hypothetical protein KAFR_0G02710 [Kazachstania africana CBS 2517]|uniref:CHCH domain-containing protein n=1 Tax=Kazachstania africana (strain ATCC 22294 / BCRC 22015 / CBS 2517 / CECT 1963 / NBRC 1671 / NRRL Y-8276) TaxID=1071382 RepID=H2AY52_KAZAF|nr:hypothetical protein KAFR_0G02710 [Kazachstania africana CBS 2517]CCF59302.1 hypothetical protein KAFR_0G02710 [Kazachstania africana CBS 2517]